MSEENKRANAFIKLIPAEWLIVADQVQKFSAKQKLIAYYILKEMEKDLMHELGNDIEKLLQPEEEI